MWKVRNLQLNYSRAAWQALAAGAGDLGGSEYFALQLGIRLDTTATQQKRKSVIVRINHFRCSMCGAPKFMKTQNGHISIKKQYEEGR